MLTSCIFYLSFNVLSIQVIEKLDKTEPSYVKQFPLLGGRESPSLISPSNIMTSDFRMSGRTSPLYYIMFKSTYEFRGYSEGKLQMHMNIHIYMHSPWPENSQFNRKTILEIKYDIQHTGLVKNKLKYLSRDMAVSMKTIKHSGLAECVSSFIIVWKYAITANVFDDCQSGFLIILYNKTWNEGTVKFCLLILSSVEENLRKVKLEREMKMNLEYKTATLQFDMVVVQIPQWSFNASESRGGILHLTNTDHDGPDRVPGKNDCMLKSATNHYHLSFHSEVQYFLVHVFLPLPFFFDNKLSSGEKKLNFLEKGLLWQAINWWK